MLSYGCAWGAQNELYHCMTEVFIYLSKLAASTYCSKVFFGPTVLKGTGEGNSRVALGCDQELHCVCIGLHTQVTCSAVSLSQAG